MVTFWSTHLFYSTMTPLIVSNFTYYIEIWLKNLHLENQMNVIDLKIFHLTWEKSIGAFRADPSGENEGGLLAQLFAEWKIKNKQGNASIASPCNCFCDDSFVFYPVHKVFNVKSIVSLTFDPWPWKQTRFILSQWGTFVEGLMLLWW